MKRILYSHANRLFPGANNYVNIDTTYYKSEYGNFDEWIASCGGKFDPTEMEADIGIVHINFENEEDATAFKLVTGV